MGPLRLCAGASHKRQDKKQRGQVSAQATFSGSPCAFEVCTARACAPPLTTLGHDDPIDITCQRLHLFAPPFELGSDLEPVKCVEDVRANDTRDGRLKQVGKGRQANFDWWGRAPRRWQGAKGGARSRKGARQMAEMSFLCRLLNWERISLRSRSERARKVGYSP